MARKLRWARTELTRRKLSGEVVDEVPCLAFGELAVCKVGRTWTIEHVATGFGVCNSIRTFKSQRDAKRAVEAIYPMLEWSLRDSELIAHIQARGGHVMTLLRNFT